MAVRLGKVCFFGKNSIISGDCYIIKEPNDWDMPMLRTSGLVCKLWLFFFFSMYIKLGGQGLRTRKNQFPSFASKRAFHNWFSRTCEGIACFTSLNNNSNSRNNKKTVNFRTGSFLWKVLALPASWKCFLERVCVENVAPCSRIQPWLSSLILFDPKPFFDLDNKAKTMCTIQ